MKTLFSSKNFISLFAAFSILAATLGLTTAAAAQSSCGATYTVQPGDYLTKIARTCGVSYSNLLKANPGITNPSLTYPGQILNIPSGSNPGTTSGPVVYSVLKGETLFSIGQHFALSVAELREANPGLGSTISTGQALNIPARIRFATGETSGVVSGHLAASSKHTYLLNAGAGQALEVTLSAPAGPTLAILGADGSTLQSASSSLTFRRILPKSQDYVLVVASGSSAVDYSLNVDIPLRIRFAPDGTSAVLTGTLSASLSQYFILTAAKGQNLTVTAAPDASLQLVIYGVDGSVLRSGMGQGASFSGALPSTQDYVLVLRSANQVLAFTMNVSIPAGAPVPVSGTRTYTVQKGDTLFGIAWHFQTTVSTLLRANPEIANKNIIPIGQIIYLPGATLKLSNGQVVYITKSSDMLAAIARQFNTTLSLLIRANPQISNPNLIYPGQRINIP